MEDYERIKPSVFVGPPVWRTIDCYAASYDPKTQQDVDDMKQWLYLTIKLFPCKECSKHGLDTWKTHNIDHYLQDKDRLYLYTSGVLHEGANDHKHIPMADRPDYYECKRYIFQSLNGECQRCRHSE